MLQADRSPRRTGPDSPCTTRFKAPLWVAESVNGSRQEQITGSDGLEISVRQSENFTVVSSRIIDARNMDTEQLREKTEKAYRLFFSLTESRHLVRIWNFIPGLLEPVGESLQRYMVFNAGRHDAFFKRFNGDQQFNTVIPTASGVGTAGDDLEMYALASQTRGTALTNPRQVDSFHYSRKFGPLPPCFARATRVTWPGEASARLLVGGTASVRGEETVFVDNLEAQTEETFKNLAAVVAVGLNRPDLNVDDPIVRKDLLSRFRHVRTYLNHEKFREAVASSAHDAFPHAEPVELASAALCREGLLVEIEGWADLA